MSTILIIEDEKGIVDLISFNLKREGYEIMEAYDGKTGLDMALSGKADLVLLDELDDVVVMCEVKTRRVALECTTRVFPEEAVDAQKQRRYRRIASCYLMEHYPLKAIRFDAVGVTIRGGHIAEIEHQYNAFDWQVS